MAPVFARVDDHDPDGRAERPQNEQMKQAHAAAAQDHREPRPFSGRRFAGSGSPIERGEDRAAAQAPQDAGGRLEEDGVEVVQGFGEPSRRRREGTTADQDLPGETAGLEEVLPEGRALGLGTAHAVVAHPAGRMMRHDETVGRRERRDSRADGLDLADDFVAEHGAGRRCACRQFEQVGAAEAAPAQAQDELPGGRHGVGELLEPRLAEGVDRHRLHRGVSFHHMERRIHRRFPRRIELRYWRSGEVQGHTAYSTNISKSGLFLSSSSPLASGERVRLEVIDRECGFVAEGRVTRIHRVPLALRHVDQQGVGVRFLLPEELVEDLVPLARQSGPATQGGREVGFDSPVSVEWNAAGASTEAATQPEAEPELEPVPAMDAGRDKIVPIAFADASAFLSTYHRDISAGGLFISTPTPMQLQEAVWIEMQLPIPGERPKLFAARVVQRFDPLAAVGDGRNLISGMAVQFVEPEKVLTELKPFLAVLRR